MTNQNILKGYSSFNNKQNIIRILVSYIKPSFLFKSDVLTPIHLGREVAKQNSKEGVISDDDLKWLYNNCIGDDNFEGSISKHNRRVGFLTGTYWAWKNYDKLGTPDYFGSFGYRKLLAPHFLDSLQQYDAILPKKVDFNIATLKDVAINLHTQDAYDRTISIVKKIHPKESQKIENYFNSTSTYTFELYILKKELFFDFCAWIFAILFEFLKTERIEYRKGDMRDIAYSIEWLTGYYLKQVSMHYNVLENEVIVTKKQTINKENITKNVFARLRKRL